MFFIYVNKKFNVCWIVCIGIFVELYDYDFNVMDVEEGFDFDGDGIWEMIIIY